MLIRQEELPMVALASMNDTHLEDIIMINELAQLIEDKKVDEISRKLDVMLAHTVEHFGAEEKMMLEKAFPAYLMHKNEHERALAQMKEAVESWKKHKNLEELRDYIEAVMPAWLVQHVSTMDTVTARFLAS
ncbi:hemerythrin family protein [Sulfurimonas sp. HSL3-7]|uniref:bacteriohemerythrin n=1 Tax=Sulfonitrofixus jiaomeiensis TaxID=3131938 RepID=UPI0031F92067